VSGVVRGCTASTTLVLSDAAGRNDLLSGTAESADSLETAAGFTVARAAAATSEIVILDAAGRNNLLPGSAESAISLATTAEVTAARAVAAESALALVDAAAYIGGELVEATAESALVLDVAAESAISLTVAAGRNNIVAAAATSVLDLTDRSGPVLVVLEDLPEQDPRVEQNLSAFLADLEDEMGVGVRTGENPGRFGIVLALFER